jgi:hypothetical protein
LPKPLFRQHGIDRAADELGERFGEGGFLSRGHGAIVKP